MKKAVFAYLFIASIFLSSCTSKKQERLWKEAYEGYVQTYPGYTWDMDQFILDSKNNNLEVSISFDTNGGSIIEPISAHKGEEVDVSEESQKLYYTFDGWYFDTELTNKVSSKFIAEGSLTLYAKFSDRNYSAIYYLDGQIYTNSSYTRGSKLDNIQPEHRPGYRFMGWKNSEGELFHFDDDYYGCGIKLYGSFEKDYLNLPVVSIVTEGNQPITSKEDYVSSTVSIDNVESSMKLTDVAAGVRGRGNTSWEMPKKSYRIKFDKKQSVLGSSYKAKSWTLIANFGDKSLLRNYLAYELSDQLDGLSFTSTHKLVDFYLNEKYLGVYLLCDQMQTGSGRVDIDESIALDGNNGYLIELDNRASSEGIEDRDWFKFDNLKYGIKTPETDDDGYLANVDVEVSYLKNYLGQCRSAISSGTWEEVNALMDINSFVDGYLVDELFGNVDVNLASFYLYKDKDGKLTRGPVWDFDVSSGNANYTPGNENEYSPNVGLYAAETNYWYNLLSQRSEFVSLVKTRLPAIKPSFDNVVALIDTNSETSVYINYKDALERNFDAWDIMGQYIWPNPNVITSLTTYKDQLDYLSSWLSERYEIVCSEYELD